jgi:hypothetical protein
MSAEPSLLSSPPLPPSADAPVATPPPPPPRFALPPPIRCSRCGGDAAPAANAGDGRPVCARCVGRLAREVVAAASGPRWKGAVALGLVGAVVGAAVWAAIAVIGEVEIGYVAVLVGFLAGLGVRVGAGQPGRGLQVLAVGLALVGLVLAKLGMIAGIAMDAGVSPFAPEVRAFLGEHLGEMLSPFDLLWIALAVGAAWKVPAPAE